jgi:dTDP-4-amino-4,6-dideoxygalactose transaminase
MRLSDPETVIATRRENFLRLSSHLRGHIPIPPPFDELPDGVCPLFVPALVDDKIRFQEEMAKLGVQTVNLWQDHHPACPADLAEEVSPWRDHIIELPIHQGLVPADVDRVAEAALTVLGGY